MAEATIEHEKGSWLGFFAKLAFFLIVLFTIAIMVLMSLGGKSEVLKESIEEYLSGRFGGVAEIETFNQMTFYPYMGIDMAGIKVYEDAQKTKTNFSADKIVAAMGFWDFAFSNGQLKTLDVENLRANPGMILDKGLTVNKLAIIDEGDKAFIRGDGKIGSSPFDVEALVEKVGKGSKKTFKFGDSRPFTAKFGSVNVKGTVENLDVDTMNITDFSIGLTDTIFSGNLDVYYGGEERFKVKGDLTYMKGSKIKPDILVETLKTPNVTGSLKFEELILDEAMNYPKIIELSDAIIDVLGAPKQQKAGYDLTGANINIDANIEKLVHNNVAISSIRTPVKLSNGDLHIGPIKSGFQSSDLSGDIHFKTSQKPALLTHNTKLKNWDYGAVQKAFKGVVDVKGRADVIVDLTATGNNEAELKDTLTGKVSFISGAAEFPVETLNFWGGGLMNSMLPDLDKSSKSQLNCGIADFTLENGEAKTNALFIDTDRVTLQGEGTYNVPKDYLDLQFTPKPKSVAIIDVATPVKVEGPLNNPEISPSAFGLGKKIGGLALGLINPAFLAYSLTDLGLTDSHPCAEFIENGKEEKAE